MNVYEEYLACQRDFVYFCTTYLKTNHPLKGLIPFELHDFQKKYINFCEENNYTIALKFRHGGFTTITVLYALWNCMFHSNLSYFFAAKTTAQAIHIGNIINTAIEHFPIWLKPIFIQNTKENKKFLTTNSQIRFGNINGIKNCLITHLILDDAAFIKDLDSKWLLLYKNNSDKIIAISTPNGIGNWFEEVYHDASKKLNNFKIHKTNYLDHPIYSNKEWVEETKKALGEIGWQQEVLANFLGSTPDYQTKEVLEFSKFTTKDLVLKTSKILNCKNVSNELKCALHELLRRISERNDE